MKRFYTSSGAKFFSFWLVAAFTVCAVLLTCCTLSFTAEGCYPGQRYENSDAYRGILSDHIISAANLYRMESEDLSALPYVDQRERESLWQSIDQALSPENSNFRFQIRSEDGKKVLFSNFSDSESFESLGIEPQYASIHDGKMVIYFPSDIRYTFAASADHLFFNDYEDTDDRAYSDYTSETLIFNAWNTADSDAYAALKSSSASSYILCYGIVPGYPAKDSLFYVNKWYLNMQRGFPGFIFGAVSCALLAILSLIFLCCGAGRRASGDAITLRLFDRIPFEIVLIMMTICAGIAYACIEDLYYQEYLLSTQSTRIFFLGAYAGILLILTEMCIVTAAVRTKANSFWHYTLIGRFCGLCRNLFSHFDLCWKLVLFYIFYEFISLIFSQNDPSAFFLMAIVNFFLLLIACRWAVKFSAVRTGAEELAKGNLEYRINVQRLPPLLRQHANDLNHISDGMSASVAEQMKSERLKSELITNVSHDIKTPLTSIINYVDLIKAEHVDNPKIQEYIAVLDRQSARLKKLTNDLVDASKASSGTLPVHLEDIDIGELLQQATGEYSERLSAANLTPVFSLPEAPVYIRADGALLWRVIDNLLSNICKYALSGTRVYLSAESDGASLTVSVKNISRAALNIPAGELMERFVRGDSSRSSEGSGLGLSIAQSLTELMGGTFSLEIDGDLFKASFAFPVISKPQAGESL